MTPHAGAGWSASGRPWRLDPLMVAAAVLLSGLGILNLAALGQAGLAQHQAVAVAFGLGLMLLAARTSRRSWPWLGWLVYGLAVLMLLALVASGGSPHGARRWLSAGPLALQPSELAKLGLLLVLARVLGGGAPAARVAAALGLAGLPVLLTLLEPDLSTSVLLVTILAALLIQARTRAWILALLLGGAAGALPLAERLLRPYQLARLHDFLVGGGWTVLQAHVAIASGGLAGIDGSAPSRLLAEYLPARETDLAFASLVEQRGLLAGSLVLLATAGMVWRLALIAARSREAMGALLAGGLAVLLGTEVAVSVAGNLGLLPIAGVPCPLLSYGGTAAVAHLTALGLVGAARVESRRTRLSRPPWRFHRPPRLARVLAVGLSAALVALGYAGLQLQRSRGASLRNYAAVEMTRWITLPAPRGVISDRHGDPLAVDAALDALVVVPGVLNRDPRAAPRLAGLVGITPAALQAELGTTTEPSVTLSEELSPAAATAIAAEHLPGVIVVPSSRRLYLHGSLLAPVLGFVGVATPAELRRVGPLPPRTVVGRSGLELEYDSVLRGEPGAQSLLVEPSGLPATMGHTKPAAPGGDLRLSLDLGLQRATTEALATALRGAPGQPRGEQGAVVVLRPRTGEVLAMASLPAYDDNLYGPPPSTAALGASLAGPGNPGLQHATQEAAPPGSTFKLVVGAADVLHGAIPPSRVIPTGGSLQVGSTTFHNWRALPPQNLVQAIAWSNDVYFYKLALALGPQRIAGVADELGVGRRSGIDLPGEVGGFLGTPDTVASIGESWYTGSTVLMGIGQGALTATPLQVARWTSAVATGAVVTPHLGLATRTGSSPLFSPIAPPGPRQLGYASLLGPLRDGLRLAVVQGTGTMLRSLPLPAGGKTGTAEDPSAPNGGPDAWYTAVAPLDDPEVAVTVFVRGGGEGYYTAEPAAASILQYYAAHRAEILPVAPVRPGQP